jgi:hypothetical protein
MNECSALQEKEIKMLVTTWVYLEDMASEINQDRQILYDIMYVV